MNSFNVKFMIFILLSFAIVLGFNFKPWLVSSQHKHVDSPVLALTNSQGRTSSAVYIGNGYILTSDHGLNDDKAVTLTTESGDEVLANHLWSAERYDIALYRVEGRINTRSYTLDCSPLELHDRLYFIGNPMVLRHITLTGTVAGDPLYNLTDIWEQVVPVQAPIVPGMSGGAAIDSRDRLRGINIGTMVHRQGFGHSYTGIGYIIPSEVICMLLGK
jgi:serine protease Do